MKIRTLVVAGGVALLIVAGVMLVPRSKEAPASNSTARAELATTLPASKSGERETETKEGKGLEQPPLTDDARAAILKEIEQASVTYDAKALPDIEPYLLHPDPEVRQAALNGMLILGDAVAGPLLRKAAEKAPTPKEAVAFQEAADYVELPAGSFVPKERTAPGTRVPAGSKLPERKRPKTPLTPPEPPPQTEGE